MKKIEGKLLIKCFYIASAISAILAVIYNHPTLGMSVAYLLIATHGLHKTWEKIYDKINKDKEVKQKLGSYEKQMLSLYLVSSVAIMFWVWKDISIACQLGFIFIISHFIYIAVEWTQERWKKKFHKEPTLDDEIGLSLKQLLREEKELDKELDEQLKGGG